MLKNYLKSALRNIIRYKGYSLINIIGLAIGIAASLAVLMWVWDEVSYDKFHKNSDSVYRCYRKINDPRGTWFSEVMSAPIAPKIMENTPGILDHARLYDGFFGLNFQGQAVHELGKAVDPGFFNIFTFPFVVGDPATALASTNSIVLTERVAVAMFADQNPVGQILDNGLTVTGIIADPPINSSIDFAYLVPMAYAEQIGAVDPEEWWNFSMETYFMLADNTEPEKIEARIMNLFEEVTPDSRIELHLQPLADIHLKDISGGGRIVYVYIFTVVAILLLAVACINFMNLATARAAKRTIEIGLRKTVGASRWQLIRQILSESLVQTSAALVIAICILEASHSLLEDLFGKQLTLTFSIGLVLTLLAIVLFTAVAAGIYPALVLSSLRPATVLKRASTGGSRAMNLVRKALVVFQFTVSAALIFSALVIYGQLNHIDNKELGIEKENIVTIRTDKLEKDYAAFKSELRRHPGITNVCVSYEPPAWCGWMMTGFDYEDRPEDRVLRSGVAWVDYDYVDVFGMEIIEGRNFSPEYATDGDEAYLINEAAARAMEMESPIGKTLDFEEKPGKIIGVLKDFHFSSLHNPIQPLILGMNESYYSFLCIKMAEDDIMGSMTHIERVWKEMRPGEEYRYRFFGDLLSREYNADVQTGKIVLGFTMVTVLVACMGLFGLVMYSAERRTKEIGIRKVLGSSAMNIVGLLTREFLTLVLLGYIIAAPLAYYFCNKWLGDFAYRIGVGWHYFVLSALAAIVIALATVCYQALKAAHANPVDALKYE